LHTGRLALFPVAAAKSVLRWPSSRPADGEGFFMSDKTPKYKDPHERIAELRQALDSNSECGTSHYNLAVALMGAQRFAEAEEALHRAIDCSPSLAEAYAMLGGLCLRSGDLDGCLDWNRRAVKARPGFSEGYGNIGFVQLQRGDVDAAISALEKATHFNFRFVQALTTLANAYLMAGRVQDSIATNLKVIDLEPNFAVAHNNLAIAYLEQGQFDKAAQHLKLAEENGYPVADRIRGDILSGLGNA
jgi:tetratricopeptide (TPR) repeat protein